MRLVSWNVCDGFERKFGHLERLKPDIAILQEVRPACLAYAGLSDRAVWIGDEGQKGLTAVAYGDWQLERASIEIPERWFLPLVAHKGSTTINLVAVWVDSSKECGPPTLRALEQLQHFIETAPTIMAGDFNHCVSMDKRKGPGRRFADVLSVMEESGLKSAWHSFHQEEHGAETAATLYWTWNAERRFHIDFVFHAQGLPAENVSIGTYEAYVSMKISDHVPVTVDFSLPEGL
jgi:endonuclease/exonuclease/phosphatase family metal-dependent hydrolase